MELVGILRFLCLSAIARLGTAAPVSQAGEPITVHVNFDVPTYGAASAEALLRSAAAKETKLAQSRDVLERLLKQGALRGVAIEEPVSFLNMAADPSDVPIVNIQLAPPSAPYPDVAAKIEHLDKARLGMETDFAQDLARLYDDALGAAKQQIQKVIAAASLSRRDSGKSAPTFLALDGSRADGFDMQISMVAPHEIAPEVNALVAKIEQKRTALEERLFSEARRDMVALTSFVLQELRLALGSTMKAHGVGFLASEQAALPQEASVRLLSSAAGFPRVADLIQAMEARRDQAETSERKHILDLEAKLLKAENAMIREALSR